jgi:hypothetical protein
MALKRGSSFHSSQSYIFLVRTTLNPRRSLFSLITALPTMIINHCASYKGNFLFVHFFPFSKKGFLSLPFSFGIMATVRVTFLYNNGFPGPTHFNNERHHDYRPCKFPV